MAQRHAERQQAAPLEWVDACDILGPDATLLPGHRGHHLHWEWGATVCSCGKLMGVACIAIDPRYFSDDPAEVAAAEREDEDFRAWVTCCICGRTGVQANGLGWPPEPLYRIPA